MMYTHNRFRAPGTYFTPEFRGAYPPLPRSTWVHHHVPVDTYDLVCKSIWLRAKKTNEDLDEWKRLNINRMNVQLCNRDNNKPKQRVEQKQTCQPAIVDEKTGNQTNTLQLPRESRLHRFYRPGLRQPHTAKPAPPQRPLMETETRPTLQQAHKKEEGSLNNREHTQKSVRVDTDRNKTEAKPLLANPCPTTEGTAPHLPPEDDLYPASSKLLRDTCESEDEPDASTGSSEGSSSDYASLPSIRSAASGSSDDVVSDIEEEAPQLQASTLSIEFPRLCTAVAGINKPAVKDSTSGKVQGQWEKPLIDNTKQDKVFDLQTDFPALRRDANVKANGDQKSVADLQTLNGTSQLISAPISCEPQAANNQLAPGGTDGVGAAARTRTIAAKAGTKQAAAPKEKARPCTVNRTGHSVTPNNAQRAGPNQRNNPGVKARGRGQQVQNQHVRPVKQNCKKRGNPSRR